MGTERGTAKDGALGARTLPGQLVVFALGRCSGQPAAGGLGGDIPAGSAPPPPFAAILAGRRGGERGSAAVRGAAGGVAAATGLPAAAGRPGRCGSRCGVRGAGGMAPMYGGWREAGVPCCEEAEPPRRSRRYIRARRRAAGGPRVRRSGRSGRSRFCVSFVGLPGLRCRRTP